MGGSASTAAHSGKEIDGITLEKELSGGEEQSLRLDVGDGARDVVGVREVMGTFSHTADTDENTRLVKAMKISA